MKKKILVFGMALLIYAGSSMTASAAMCPNPNAPCGKHYFNSCKPVSYGGRIENLGYHRYLYGYDNNGKPIYGENCLMTQGFQYCKYVCFYCGLESPNGAHEHPLEVRHSVSHN